MQDRIRIFEQRTKNKQSSNRNNSVETPIKNYVKNANYPQSEFHKNKFLETSGNDDNSYARQSIKRKSILKNNKDKNNILSSIFLVPPIKSKNKAQCRSIEKNNFTYKRFVDNLRLGIINDNEYHKNVKKNKNKKKKNIFGNFLHQFVNKAQIEEEQNNTKLINNNYNSKLDNMLILCKINNDNFYIEGERENFNAKDKNNDNNVISKLKKELHQKEEKIKQLNEIIEKQNKMILENKKLKEEIQKLRNMMKNTNKKDIIQDNKNQDNPKISINIENHKFNNLITYNINKNNNYNIKNSKINNFDELNNSNNNNQEPFLEGAQKIEKEKEKNEIIKKKNTKAFERFKRANRSIDLSNDQKENNLKSEKVSSLAKMLEGHIKFGNEEKSQVRNRESSVEVKHKNENEEIFNIINNQPVVNKKKKKVRSFSYDG